MLALQKKKGAHACGDLSNGIEMYAWIPYDKSK